MARILAFGLLQAVLIASCGSSAGENKTHCRIDDKSRECLCRADFLDDDVGECSATSVGANGLCCQEKDTCRCNSQVCIDDGTYCTCYTYDGLNYKLPAGRIVPSCQKAEGLNCCMKRDSGSFGGYCRCLENIWVCADHGEDDVESCTIPHIASCGPDATRVDSCR
jgi:hypothetical protein